MSDREDEPTDLFDAVCRLDDLADWLESDYLVQAGELRAISSDLKGYIEIVLTKPVERSRS